VSIDGARLARFAGRYDEGRAITFQNGRLWYQRRAGVLADELVPLADNRFALNGTLRVSFEPRGAGFVLNVESADGTRLSYARM
jgi:hypothetical protein